MQGLSAVNTRSALLCLVVLSSGCATVRPASVLTDDQVSAVVEKEALGELGEGAFKSRDERLAFDAHAEVLVRRALEVGPRSDLPVLEALRLRCEQDLAATRADCSWVDQGLTLHSLWKKPRLNRLYVSAVKVGAGKADQVPDLVLKLSAVDSQPKETFTYQVEAFEYVEGYRPRG